MHRAARFLLAVLIIQAAFGSDERSEEQKEFEKNLNYPAAVKQLDEKNFNSTVAATKGALVVDFYAPWCPHCQREAPVFGQLATLLKSDKVAFAAVNCMRSRRLCFKQQKIKGFPTFKVYRHNGPVCTHIGEWEKSRLSAFVTAVTNSKYSHSCPSKKHGAQPKPKKKKKRPALQRDPDAKDPRHPKHNVLPARRVMPQDLSAAVHFGWAHAVFVDGPLSGSRLKAMRRWIRVLARLPGGKTRKSLQQLYATLGKQKVWHPAQWKHLTKNVELWGQKKGQSFVVCAGIRHGYACGLWQLFHSLLVNAKDRFEAFTAVNAIKGYVTNFFGCEPCQHHFVAAFKRTLPSGARRGITSPRAAALWLWKLHNGVSTRLAPRWGAKKEEVLYPPSSACSKCRKEKIALRVRTPNTKLSPYIDWDHKKVYGFLKKIYGGVTKEEEDEVAGSTMVGETNEVEDEGEEGTAEGEEEENDDDGGSAQDTASSDASRSAAVEFKQDPTDPDPTYRDPTATSALVDEAPSDASESQWTEGEGEDEGEEGSGSISGYTPHVSRHAASDGTLVFTAD